MDKVRGSNQREGEPQLSEQIGDQATVDFPFIFLQQIIYPARKLRRF